MQSDCWVREAHSDGWQYDYKIPGVACDKCGCDMNADGNVFPPPRTISAEALEALAEEWEAIAEPITANQPQKVAWQSCARQLRALIEGTEQT